MAFVKGKTENPNDVIMTPRLIAKKIIDMFPLHGKILDPFKGQGAFYDQLPNHLDKRWDEISEGHDFFERKNERFDWIISNPPYSKFTEVMKHSYELADNIVYLIPLNKIVSSWGRVKDLKKYGGIVKLFIMQSSKCNFPFGFPACAVHIKKGYHGKIEWIVDEEIKQIKGSE